MGRSGSESLGAAARNGESRRPLLVRSLCDAGLYDHPVEDLRVVETHISYLILTGHYAYKIKKPVTLPFLDFSTVDKRGFYCREEVRLNRRLAPDLYLDVVSITGDAAHPRLDGDGPVIEYAVKMVQFDTDQEVDALLARGQVAPALIVSLADDVAGFHESAARTDSASRHGSFRLVRDRIMDNFVELERGVGAGQGPVLEALRIWAEAECASLRGTIDDRRRAGYVRECHGDMHTGNMVLIGDRIRLFDCLEFNEDLRWVDVMSEVAFLTMDLNYHGRRDLAFYFLNRYLSVGGDYTGLRLLPLYVVYRAMVRAKVACIRDRQSPGGNDAANDVADHLRLALSCTEPRRARLYINHGLSGSGKSWTSEKIAPLIEAIHIRSDVERDRAGAELAEPMADRAVRYSAENIARVYDRLLGLAEVILSAGFSVLVDATFLMREQRRKFIELANDTGAPLRILDFRCPEQVLRARVAQRSAQGRDASEADVSVLEKQLRDAEPLDRRELEHAIPVVSTDDIDVVRVAQHIGARA